MGQPLRVRVSPSPPNLERFIQRILNEPLLLYGSFVMHFNEVFAKLNWKPIRNCPGRYALAGPPIKLSPKELLSSEFEVFEFNVPTAKDIILVVRFEGGGLISYQKADGTYLHTLNTAEGFSRKLNALGIELS